MSWRSSCGPGTRKPPPLSDTALSSYFEISLPYADDSDAITESASEVSLPQCWRPKLGGPGGGPPAATLSRKNSYCSHGSRWSYSSHALDHPPLSSSSSYHMYRSASRSGWYPGEVVEERPYPPTSDDNLNSSSYPPDYLVST
eukprot:snap_masked-scaffold524_size146631-processed-gene-0.3 protein:Tk03330 transcript:snap_masked-scaffold524_size146631-processed-gene-0.3-mRNA-1 annotation:"voltage-gated sodium channel"